MSKVLEHPEPPSAETDYHAFNKSVWDRVCDDSALADLPYQVETDKYGKIVMSPPPAPSHGSWQSRIVIKLYGLIVDGEIVTECPISTASGVKGADVAWCSSNLWQKYISQSCFLECPQVCVEILSPRNTRREITEKKALYFEEGAKEVWLCTQTGEMQFYLAPDMIAENSELFPDFPEQLER